MICRLLLLDDARRVELAETLSELAPGGDPANLLSADQLPHEVVSALHSLEIKEDRLLAAINLVSSADEGLQGTPLSSAAGSDYEAADLSARDDAPDGAHLLGDAPRLK